MLRREGSYDSTGTAVHLSSVRLLSRVLLRALFCPCSLTLVIVIKFEDLFHLWNETKNNSSRVLLPYPLEITKP